MGISSRTSIRSYVWARGISFAALFLLLFALSTSSVAGQVKRLVLIKVDGLPDALLDRYTAELDPQTGKSQLPWIERVFYKNGTRLSNFYTRGMSLSGPSWSLLDTGQHLQIKGNVEFDRFTLHSYDYLNFFPFYVNSALQRRVDMPGPEVLDELGIPLFIDAFNYDQRYQSFQLYQRGVRWTTLQRGLKNRFAGLGPKDLLDEWSIGLGTRDIMLSQLERELIQKLGNPDIKYLDYFTTEFDHAAHHNRDRDSQLTALKDLDRLIGRVWSAVENSQQAAETVVVMVSDHGFNSDEQIYSQGFNLVKFLGSPKGGGHHVITKRRLLLDYSIKGVYPLVPLITTTTEDSIYLKGQSTDYPTALVDFDGNERSSIHLRDSDLNIIHILFQQLQRDDLSPEVRRAAVTALFDTIDSRRRIWETEVKELQEELGALRGFIQAQKQRVDAQPKKWTKADMDAGRDKEGIRNFARMDSAMADERDYSQYVRTLTNLLALKRDNFDPKAIRIPDYIAKGAMGEPNTIQELQNYVIGPSSRGLVLAADGTLDMSASFRRLNYFSALKEIRVSNNVQQGISSAPIDFVATRVDAELIRARLPETPTLDGVVWLYGGPDRQGLILSRRDQSGQMWIRYVPVAELVQTASGELSFSVREWNSGLPLRIFEDPDFAVPASQRSAWLNDWHSDTEWLKAVHKTRYSNGVIGLAEQMVRHPGDSLDTTVEGLTEDERLLRRFRARQRTLVEADLLILADNHWNFDVRGFNPGGNHGSFFRVSTHATLMFAGGAKTGISKGLNVDEPYDSLSLVPTLFALTGRISSFNNPDDQLAARGFKKFPGPPIKEVLAGSTTDPKDSTVAKGRRDQ